MTAKSTAMEAGELASMAFRLLGATLTDVAVTRHFYPASDVGSDLDWFLAFDSVGWVALRGASDGYGVRIEIDEAPEPVDMQELGYIAVVPSASDPRLSSLLGTKLDSVDLISLPWSAEPIGVQLSFGKDNALILNWGDELLVTNELPDFVVDGQDRPAVFQRVPVT